MATAESDSGIPSRQRRIRFSLLAILVIVTICSLILGGWRITRHYTVTSYLKISEPHHLFSTGDRFSPQGWEVFQQTQVQLVTSDAVLRAALKQYRQAKGSSLRVPASEVKNLGERLRVSFPGEGEILELRIDGKGLNAGPDLEILNQIVYAYEKEFFRVRKLDQDDQVKKMKKALDKLRAEAKEKAVQADRIEKDEGSDSIDVRLLRSDIEQLIQNALNLNRQIRELESEQPNRFFRVMQGPAVQRQ